MSLKFSLLWVVAALALYFTFSFLMGMRFERERGVMRDNATLTRELFETRAAAQELRELALSIQIEHIASIERLNAIAADFEVSREQQQTHFARQRAALAVLLAKRPDLDVPVGADVMRHWQASNAGGDATGVSDTPPAAGSGGIDAAVSTVADAGGGDLGEFDCEPRCGYGALSPVPDDAAPLDRSDGCVGAGGTADVVCGDEAGRATDGDMR